MDNEINVFISHAGKDDGQIEKFKTLKNILTKDVDMVMLKYNLNLDENGVPSLSSNPS